MDKKNRRSSLKKDKRKDKELEKVKWKDARDKLGKAKGEQKIPAAGT